MHNPCRIYFADEALQRAKSQLIKLGTKALIVTGKSSARLSGALDDVLDVLAEAKIEHFHFNKVNENPDLDTVIDGVTQFVMNDCDFIIGIGGGSPMDAAKAISLTAANKLDKYNIYDTSCFQKRFPVVAIPTTAGSGSEVTPYSVLTDKEQKKKAGFGDELAFPSLSILEPRYTLSTSTTVTLNTGVDALSHLLEGIYSNKRNVLLYPQIFDGVKAIYTYLPIVMREPDNLLARTELMRASLFGGLAIAQTSTTLQHSIGYPLTTEFDIPHGLANGIVMKSIMELYYPNIAEPLEELFGFLGITRKHFYQWLETLQLSVDIHLPRSFIDEKLDEVINSRNMANNPMEINPESIRKIFEELSK